MHDLPTETGAPPEPWYSGGLAFTCTGCGDCCTGSPGFVWVDDADVAAIARHLDVPIGEIRLMHTRPARGRVSLTEFANGDCTFFDSRTRRCRIYPVRPRQCRTWPFWRSHLETPEAWEQTRAICPGAGTGELLPLVQIESLAAEIPL